VSAHLTTFTGQQAVFFVGTAAHLPQSPRMTLMFCAFTGAPLILRLYGQARMAQPGDAA